MSLNSESVIKIVDLLCEGPIDAIEGAKKGIFLDESPLRAQTGSTLVRNSHVSYELRQGGRTQSALPQAKGKTSNVINVNKEVGQGYTEILNGDGTRVKRRVYGSGSQTVQITDTDVDSVDLIFTVPRLFSTAQESLVKGQLFDAEINFDIKIQDVGSGSGFKRVKKTSVDEVSEDFKGGSNNVYVIQGISTTNYQYQVSGIQLPGKGPWNIKVTKYPNSRFHGEIPHSQSNAATIDKRMFAASFKDFEDVDKRTPLKDGRANTFIWSAVVEHVDIRTAYPYSACVGMSISTEEFQTLPTRAYLVRGKRVQIPHNATPRDDGSLEFNGGFNGKLKGAKWTTCPVCIFYDLLTNKRFGAGHFIDKSNLNWVDLYPLARYANELIDGEPRFACNVQVSSQAQAYTVLQDFASIFRGMMYWQSNTIQVTADHGNLDGSNVDPVHIFANSGVVGGVFNYSGSSLKTRSTSIRVRYNDPDNFYRPNIVCIEDSALISKYGYQVKEVLAFGCTSKKQAKRMGRWMMKSEELDASTITFTVGLDGALVFPGQVFAVQDEMRAGSRLSGRISSSTTTSIVADQEITLPGGSNKVLTCVLIDGNVERRHINASASSGKTIVVNTPFSFSPLVDAIYAIDTDLVKLQKFRCLSVADSGDGTFAVVGVEFNDSIYEAADEDEELDFLDVTLLDQTPSTPVI